MKKKRNDWSRYGIREHLTERQLKAHFNDPSNTDQPCPRCGQIKYTLHSQLLGVVDHLYKTGEVGATVLVHAYPCGLRSSTPEPTGLIRRLLSKLTGR